MHEKISICMETFGGSKSGYFYFVSMGSVSNVKVELKSHQLPILVILATSLVLNTRLCT